MCVSELVIIIFYRKKDWLKKLDCADTTVDAMKKIKVCARHFELKMINDGRLARWAIPSVDTNNEPTQKNDVTTTIASVPASHSSSIDTSITASVNSVTVVPNTDSYVLKKVKMVNLKLRREKRNLQRRIGRLQAKVKKKKAKREVIVDKRQFLKCCEEYLKPNVSTLFKAQLKKKRYTADMKKLCLKIYFASSRGYQTLGKILKLPSRTTLYRYIEDMQCTVGINKQLFEAMRVKIAQREDQDPLYKYCSLSIDEISLMAHLSYVVKNDEICGFSNFPAKDLKHSIVDHATAVMVRGIFSKWKQPVGHWFVNSSCDAEEAKKNILDVIRELSRIGLVVMNVTADMGASNQGLATKLGATESNPTFFVDNIEVSFSFDPPHLLKCLRNCILNKNIISYSETNQESGVMEICEVKWIYIEEVSGFVKTYGLRSESKLTPAHLAPRSKEKMRVKYAAQVFSETVAGQIRTYVDLDKMKRESLATANFLSKFNKLFDILNSSAEIDSKTQYRAAYCGKPFQEQYLRAMLHLIEGIKITNAVGKDVTRTFPFLRGWKTTINSLLHLWQRLKTVDGVSYICTRQLNQDALKIFFGTIRTACGNNPTCVDFANIFRKQFYMHLLETDTIGSNCETNELKNLDYIAAATNSTSDPDPDSGTVSFLLFYNNVGSGTELHFSKYLDVQMDDSTPTRQENFLSPAPEGFCFAYF